jgi:hypothetical protein
VGSDILGQLSPGWVSKFTRRSRANQKKAPARIDASHECVIKHASISFAVIVSIAEAGEN